MSASVRPKRKQTKPILMNCVPLCKILGSQSEITSYVRLTRRGYSEEGLEVGVDNLMPEVTVSADGVYWHPLVSPSDGDMLVSKNIFPLAEAVECIQVRLVNQQDGMGAERTKMP